MSQPYKEPSITGRRSPRTGPEPSSARWPWRAGKARLSRLLVILTGVVFLGSAFVVAYAQGADTRPQCAPTSSGNICALNTGATTRAFYATSSNVRVNVAGDIFWNSTHTSSAAEVASTQVRAFAIGGVGAALGTSPPAGGNYVCTSGQSPCPLTNFSSPPASPPPYSGAGSVCIGAHAGPASRVCHPG